MAKFKAGEVHNPNGRPVGTGHRQQAFNALVMPHKERLFGKAIELALAGNEAMLRMFLERMMPVKPIDEPIELEVSCDLTLNGSMEMGQNILRLLAQQKITPKEAESLYSVMNYYQQNVAVVELAETIKKLDADFKKHQSNSVMFSSPQAAQKTNDNSDKL
jgi:hypothetical protein